MPTQGLGRTRSLLLSVSTHQYHLGNLINIQISLIPSIYILKSANQLIPIYPHQVRHGLWLLVPSISKQQGNLLLSNKIQSKGLKTHSPSQYYPNPAQQNARHSRSSVEVYVPTYASCKYLLVPMCKAEQEKG